MRDLDKEPYSPEESEAAKYQFDLIGIGGGNDPVGFLIASHHELVRQQTVLKAKYPAIFKEIARESEEACSQPTVGVKTEAPTGSS
jgi:hypothetical protein